MTAIHTIGFIVPRLPLGPAGLLVRQRCQLFLFQFTLPLRGFSGIPQLVAFV